MDKNLVVLNENQRSTIKELTSLETQYIYLLQEREFIKTSETIYKLGKTVQKCGRGFGERFKGYPKGSRVLLVIEVNDCNKVETDLIRVFKKEFKRRDDIGSEYFEGDINEMKRILTEIILKTKKEPVEKQVEIIKITPSELNGKITEDPIEINKDDLACTKCDKVFETNGGLWKHMKNKHENVITKIPNNVCKKCNKKLANRSSRWRHEIKCRNKTIVDELIKENKELKKIVEQLIY
jgi:hypothetical protein